MEDGMISSGFRIEITWKTILKVLLGVLLAYVSVKLWPLFKLLVIAILLAVPLHRIVSWICAKGWPQWVGLLLASAILVGAIAGLFGVVGPMAYRQASAVGKDIPKLKEQVLAQLPRSGPLNDTLQKTTNFGTGGDSQRLLEKGLDAAKTTVEGLFDLALVIVLAIYFTADGKRALQWLVAFFPAEQRDRVSVGLEEIGARMVAYVTGQSITSLLFAGYVFVFLSILHVPMALLLAVMAGIFDVLPMIGIFLALAPAVLMGLTVSPQTALIIVGGYIGYHLLEAYFLVPKVYGNKLHLSTLAVILAFTAGGMLVGVVGAIAALPLVAAYPALERLWLSPTLEPEVVEEHARIHAG